MNDSSQVTPIKLTSLREQRDIIRCNSNRSNFIVKPIIELPKSNSQISLKFHKTTSLYHRIRKIDSPRSIYESNAETNLNLIAKANAAKETLESCKDRSKQKNLVFKREKVSLKSQQAFPSSPKPSAGSVFEEIKIRKLTKSETEVLVNRLQGTLSLYKKS